jgi:hypothetical protein
MRKRQCAWKIGKAECFMVVYILWTRVANFITEKQDHRTDVQTRFLKRPIVAGKSGKAPEKALRHSSRLSNYRDTTVIAFHVRMCSSLYYPCFIMMLFKEIVQAVPIALCDRLGRHTSLTLCLPFLCRYEFQYGLKDRSNETLNVTSNMERKPEKYDVSNSRGKLQPQFIRAKNWESKKKSCWCKFNMKYLYYVRDIVEIVYYSPRHANKDSLVVHDEVRQWDRAQYATQISAKI